MQNSTPNILFLMGPTASGKTQLALNIAERIPVEIISVDSALVYRGMDIGTAKPSPEILKKFPHHLIDICDPAETYSSGRFCEEALSLITQIQEREALPILVGGTMLYFHILRQGYSAMPLSDPAIRQKIDEEAKEIGWEALHERLSIIDPIAAERIKAQDPQRIQRALELHYLSGKSMSELHQNQEKKELAFNIINFILMPPDRLALHQRIGERFDQMLEAGFIAEVQKLFERGDLNADMPSMRSVGYRQAWEYLSGETNYELMCEKAKAATRQLAKRQFTWLNKWDSKDYYSTEADNLLDLALNRIFC